MAAVPTVMPEIVLVRHAQSDANLAGAWQGRGDAHLSPEGEEQVRALRKRLEGNHFDVVATSPLVRAVETATAFGAGPPQVEDDLIEIDLGAWEGVAFGEVYANHGAVLRSIFNGADEPFGEIGERISEVAGRVWSVLDRLAEQVGPEGRAAVVTHGGVIDAVIGTMLPSVTRRPHRMVSNTALTHIVKGRRGWRLSRINDATHLHRLPEFASAHIRSGGAVMALVRHGRTKANAEGRCQGQSCWGLDEVGRRQARLLVDWYGRFDRVYASPLDRAAATAVSLTDSEVTLVDGLMEIGMGEWEGLAMTEINERWPDLVRRIYEDGEDLPRGETGETWKAVTDRIVSTIEALEAAPGQVTGVVAHGGVIRAYLGTLGGEDIAAGKGLATPENTSVTHLALTDDGPVMCDYAVAPHLEPEAVA